MVRDGRFVKSAAGRPFAVMGSVRISVKNAEGPVFARMGSIKKRVESAADPLCVITAGERIGVTIVKGREYASTGR
jgi:hypothetical protein